ncbi:hypothetical protein B1R94_08635 [Mycolicibacterium litorale]|nr:hypothetical protein B1R94_08635 [Mycolicibacterium litorale]
MCCLLFVRRSMLKVQSKIRFYRQTKCAFGRQHQGSEPDLARRKMIQRDPGLVRHFRWQIWLRRRWWRLRGQDPQYDILARSHINEPLATYVTASKSVPSGAYEMFGESYLIKISLRPQIGRITCVRRLRHLCSPRIHLSEKGFGRGRPLTGLLR